MPDLDGNPENAAHGRWKYHVLGWVRDGGPLMLRKTIEEVESHGWEFVSEVAGEHPNMAFLVFRKPWSDDE